MPETTRDGASGTPAADTIFDAAFRARLEVLKRVVARALAGRGGAGRAPMRERGGRVEFAGHRPWADGDDARNVDWNAYARLEALVVKEFEAPREAQVLLVLDRSASMAPFGKDAAALRLAAATGWLALAAGARVACCARGGASGWVAAPERFAELLSVLGRLPAGGAADLPEALRRAPVPGPGRSTAIVLGDFYEAEPAARALAVLARRHAQVACAHVLAPEELQAPAGEFLHLADAETGERLELRAGPAVRRAVAERAGRFVAERAALFARHGARRVAVAPGDDLVETVGRLVAGREARA